MLCRVALSGLVLIAIGCADVAPPAQPDYAAMRADAEQLQEVREAQSRQAHNDTAFLTFGRKAGWDPEDMAAITRVQQVAEQGAEVYNDDQLAEFLQAQCAPSILEADDRVAGRLFELEREAANDKPPPAERELQTKAIDQFQSNASYFVGMRAACEQYTSERAADATARLQAVQIENENANREADREVQERAIQQSGINAAVISAGQQRAAEQAQLQQQNMLMMQQQQLRSQQIGPIRFEPSYVPPLPPLSSTSLSRNMALYTIEQAAPLAELAPKTLHEITSRTDLIRGVDFIVRRHVFHSQPKRRLYFTERGLARLIARDYRWFKEKNRKNSAQEYERRRISNQPWAGVPPDWNLIRGIRSPEERRARLRQYLLLFSREYIRAGGCALPGCRCISHELGVPRADLWRSFSFIARGAR